MRQQYGLRIRGEEFASMTWDEFSDLLGGLNEQTPLVRVAQIRTETDPDAIRRFTPAQRAMRAEWQRKAAGQRPKEEVDAFLRDMQTAFSNMFREG